MMPAGRIRRYRAPVDNRQIFCDPPWQDLPKQVEESRAQLESRAPEIGGKSYDWLRRQARAELVAAAEKYTCGYLNYSGKSDDQLPLILTGHQPGLHHPGVWLKNFAAAQLVEQVGGIAISVIIDSDLCRSPSVRVPTGSVEDPQTIRIAFDRAGEQVPFEERAILDRETWQSFGQRATSTIASLVANPLIDGWWPTVVQSTDVTNLGEAIASARHRLESTWGVASLEVPQSLLCQTESFRRFALHLIARAARFREAYNQSLAVYRSAHRLRNPAQPVPDLGQQDDWIETPFWIWSAESPQRRPLFVRHHGDALTLDDRSDFTAELRIADGAVTEQELEQLARWERQGIKLRTRALTTTMFGRLLLADLFIHGIGGAKYDHVTDDVCTRFFGIRPPEYATITGTLRLSVEHESVDPAQELRLRQLLRNLQYHPEVALNREELSAVQRKKFDELAAEKSTWVKTIKTPENCKRRHEAISNVNNQFHILAAESRAKILHQQDQVRHRLQADRLLESREYPFCLFPQQEIQDFLLDFPSRML